jgi:hypothetical protein
MGLGSTYGFLRPSRRSEEEGRAFLERVRSEPELLREVRTSMALQLVIVGLLLAALVGLLVQSFLLIRGTPQALNPMLRWGLPAVILMLTWMVARRFFRVLRDYQRLRPDQPE